MVATPLVDELLYGGKELYHDQYDGVLLPLTEVRVHMVAQSPHHIQLFL
jgi:hypothetical protein